MRRGKRVNTRLKWHPALVGLLIIGGVLLVLSISYITGNPPGEKRQPERIKEQKSTDPKIEAEVIMVASKFICSCGACGEQPLDVCSCNTAVQERQFIRNALLSGQSADEIVVAVSATFGWMKPGFIAGDDSLSAQSLPSGQRSGISKSISTRELRGDEAENRIATSLDREAIFSNFRCPCGQCGIDELKDCACSHPRGAGEVKAFVDEKLAEGRYTIGQVIDFVDERYGSRKL